MKILITGVGGPTPRSFAISLKEYSRYANFEFIATDINPLAIGLYQQELFKKSFIVPAASHANYWDEIEKIVQENNIEFAVIQPELEVLEWSKKQEEGKLPCKVLLPDFELAKLLVDKAKMTSLLSKLDVVPKSFKFDRNEKKLEKIADYLGYPYWVRSTSGSSGLGSLKIENRESLENWIQINPNVHNFLASKFLTGRNLACKMLYYEGRLIRSAIGERVHYIMAKVAPSGITGNTSFGRLLNEPSVFKVAKKAMDSLFEHTNAKKHGFFTADFKEDENGTPYITEINVRHVAFTQCFAAAGANFAEDTMRLLDNDSNFDKEFKLYKFKKDLIFLRDVDTLPIIMKETNLL
jgi:carbamoyl-phosphate synthase large subunit